MKGLLVFLVAFFTLSLTHSSFSQSGTKEMLPGYYVVVSAYVPSKETMAIGYIKKLRTKGYEEAEYGFDPKRRFYYAYLRYFSRLNPALLYMQETRKETSFSDAWVRIVTGKIPEESEESDYPLEVNQQKEEVISKEQIPEDKGKQSARYDSLHKLDSLKKDSILVKRAPKELISKSNRKVFVSLFDAQYDRVVDGDIMVIDTEEAKLIKKIPGNAYTTIPDPQSESGQVTLLGEVFGYRKIQHEISFNTMFTDSLPFAEMVDSVYVINFDMIRYKQGDLITLYNVYFYNDACLMRPESKYELNNLVEMMRDNKEYRIKLHGHSNGNYYGKIITMGDGPEKNYFSLQGDTKTGMGSAKKLSEARAEIIKTYLIDQGIEASRIEVKAWGGMRPVYDKNSVNAKKNVRVEVEILAD